MQSIREFLKGMDNEEGTLLKAWDKHRTKKPKKSAYMIYVDNNTQQTMLLHPDLDTSKKVRDRCRDDWNKIKEEGGRIYEKYELLSSFYTKYGQEAEISTPFHLFSLFKRDEVSESNADMSPEEVTQTLKTMWNETEDKDSWEF